MSPKRLRKVALYLEYIAVVLREEADDGKKVARKPMIGKELKRYGIRFHRAGR